MSKEIDPLAALQMFVAQYPTQAAAAEALDISAPFLSDMLNENRRVSDTILEKLGLERIVTVVKAS